MFAFSKWKSAIKDNQSIVLRYYYRTLINKSRPLFGRGRLLFYFLFLSPRSFVSFLSLAKSIANGAQKRCYWGAKWGLLQTKNIEILERLQWVVVQSVMRVIMEESELVQREGDVRDEKRTTWVPSWAFLKSRNCFFANRESVFNVEIWLFLKSKTDPFQTKNRFFQIKKNGSFQIENSFFTSRKLALHKSKLDSSQINSAPQ